VKTTCTNQLTRLIYFEYSIEIPEIMCHNAQVEGLHTLTDTVAAGAEPIGINANYTIVLPTLSLNSDYFAELNLTLPEIIDVIGVSGEGLSYVNVTNTAINVGLYITQRNGTEGVQFTIKLTFGIDTIALFFEDLEISLLPIGPLPIEVWDAIGEFLRGTIIVPAVQFVLDGVTILNILTLLLDELTKECTFKEIVDFLMRVEGSDLSCVVIPWPPVKPTESPVEITEEPVRDKNGASVIGFANIMYLQILTIIGAFFSAFVH